MSKTTLDGPMQTYTKGPESSSYTIIGDDMQILSMNVQGGANVTATPGAMNYTTNDMKPEVNCDNCLNRCMAGEACCLTIWTNHGTAPTYIAVSPSYPAKVIPVPLGDGGMQSIITKQGALLSYMGEVTIGFDMDCNPTTCCCGGLGCFRSVLGGQGTAFLNAGGTVLMKNLEAGERMVIDTNSIVGYQQGVSYGVTPTGNCCVCCLGGEGCCYSTLTGPGQIYMQSMSIQKLQRSIGFAAQGGGGEGGGDGGGGGGGPAGLNMMR